MGVCSTVSTVLGPPLSLGILQQTLIARETAPGVTFPFTGRHLSQGIGMRVAQPKISTPLSGPTGTKTPTQLPRQAGGARSRANAWGTDHWHFQRNARGFASLLVYNNKR